MKDKTGIVGAIILVLLCKIIYDQGRRDAIHFIYKNGMTVVSNDELNEDEED